MSLKTDIYLSIKAMIEEDLKDDIKTFRLFNNQFEHEADENAFAYPAVFMQYENIDYVATTGGSQQGDLSATFHIGVESLKTEDLAIFDLLDKFFKALTDINIGFTRTREQQDIDHDNIQVWQQSYKITMTDDTANIHNRRRLKVTATTLDVNKEIIIDPNTYEGIRTHKEIS